MPAALAERFPGRTIEASNWQEFEPLPSEGVAIVGFKGVTPLGDEWETFNGMLEGRSGIRDIKEQLKLHPGQEVWIGGPLPPGYFNPYTRLHPEDARRGLSTNSVGNIVLARNALAHAGLLSQNGKTIVDDIPGFRTAAFVSSGIAATDTMIDVQHRIDTRGPHRISPDMSLQIFPEEPNGDVAAALGMKGGKGHNMHEACATSLSNIVELSKLIRAGHVIAGVAGGFEDALDRRPDVTIGAFRGVKALSTRNNEPEKASRPFDRLRDGFLTSSGGAVVVLEELGHAIKRGAKIWGIIRGEGNAMDGHKKTELNADVVARVIRQALYNKEIKRFNVPDVIWAHATSTPTGDGLEARALMDVFQKLLPGIPVTAIKSMIGHLLGGAGAANFVAAVQSINTGRIPRILNLEDPGSKEDPNDPTWIDDDRAIKALNLVRDRTLVMSYKSALVTGYGFGGYDAALEIVDPSLIVKN